MQHIDVASEDLEAMKRKEQEHKADHDERHHAILEADNRVSVLLMSLFLSTFVGCDLHPVKINFVIPTDQGFVEDCIWEAGNKGKEDSWASSNSWDDISGGN